MRDSEHEKRSAEQQMQSLERRERWENLWLPLLFMAPFAIGAVLLLIYQPKVFAILAALVTAAGLPFILAMSRK